MAIYFFGPDPGRIISVHAATEENCDKRDRNRQLLAAHQHVVIRFGEDTANDIIGTDYTVCDFQLKADGGWPEIEDAIKAAPKTPSAKPEKHKRKARR